MLVDTGESRVVGNLGWVDRGALWVYSVQTGAIQHVELARADHVSLYGGRDGSFAAVHHGDPDRVEITAGDLALPGEALARMVVSQGQIQASRASDMWGRLPRSFVASLRSSSGQAAYHWVHIDPAEGAGP